MVNVRKPSRSNLAPQEAAKAIAFKQVLKSFEEHQGKSCWELLGKGRAEFTASQLTRVDGKRPQRRAIEKIWAKATAPGVVAVKRRGRPPQISQAQKQAIADKAMELKKDLWAPTPSRVRACLPRRTVNQKTQAPISNFSICKVFKTKCYDENEDDPWQFLPSPQQDCLTAAIRPRRVKTAQHFLKNFAQGAAWNFVAIDPCFSLLPTNEEKSEQMKIAAMGVKKWMSKKSCRKGANLRAPSTAKTQKSNCTTVPWTPVFTRGRLKLVVITRPKAKLTNGASVAAFVKSELPAALSSMKRQWGWSNLPRVVLHDKASYFVNSDKNLLSKTFSDGLHAGGFTSWLESDGGDCKWLAAHLGDWYPHETVISHVRRLLSTKFARKGLHETVNQFASRMLKVENYMNNEMGEGQSLQDLGREYHGRSQQLIDLQGERLPK